MAGWEVLFTSVCEIFGRKRGLELIYGLAKKLEQPDDSATKLNLTRERVLLFLDEVRTHGLLIKQVVFASLRYHRWLDLNQDATQKARGTIIQELYKDYDLRNMTKKYPDTRMRFFLMTAFRDSNLILIKHLTELMNELRQLKQEKESEFQKHVATRNAGFECKRRLE